MAITKEDILEYLDSATILDLNDLVKSIEEKYGVTAAAPVAAAAAPAEAAPAATAPVAPAAKAPMVPKVKAKGNYKGPVAQDAAAAAAMQQYKK